MLKLKRALIIHIGATENDLGIYAPIFDNGEFIHIPHPESENPKLSPTYRELGYRAFFLPELAEVLDWHVHYDPEFETFTYGNYEKEEDIQGYEKLRKGDYLFFITSLKWYDLSEERPPWIEPEGYYIIGYLTIERIDKASELPLTETLNIYRNNAHVRRLLSWIPDVGLEKSMEKENWDKLILFKGNQEKSAILRVAVSFSKGKHRVTIEGEKQAVWWPNELAHEVFSFETNQDIQKRCKASGGKWWHGIVEGEKIKYIWEAIKEKNPEQAKIIFKS